MSTENVAEPDLDDQEQFGDVRCQSCEREWDFADLDQIAHVTERVEPGEVMPAGQCPECGAVCHDVPNVEHLE